MWKFRYQLHYFTERLLALSEDLYYNGYENIVNIDISQIVIDQMIKRTKACPNMVCMSEIFFLMKRGNYGL
jgi:hypothetical protein